MPVCIFAALQVLVSESLYAGYLYRRQCVRESRSTGDVALDKLSMALDDVLEGHKLEVESAE